MPKLPRISFCVKDDRKKEMTEYAEIKGFRGVGDLARFATMQYMSRFPVKRSKAVQRAHERPD